MSNTDGGHFFEGAKRTEAFREDVPTANGSALPPLPPPARPGGTIRGVRVQDPNALREGWSHARTRPVPPPKRVLGSRKARERYERELLVWEEQERKARLRASGGGPRTILVANQKGGTGKTPTVMCLASALAEARHDGSVAAWEASEERGTLLKHAGESVSEGIVELLRNANNVLASGSRTDLMRYGATTSTGAALFGSVDERRTLTGPDVEVLHDLISRAFPLNIIDSANQAHSQAFRTAMSLTDAVVIPTTVALDSIMRTVDLLSMFESGHEGSGFPPSPQLLDRTTVIITHDGRPEGPEAVAHIRRILDDSGIVHVEVPYDEHIGYGADIQWEKLTPASQVAWSNAAAQVMDTMHG